ncbi:MAG: Bax inhibitor-1/YccA family protein [Paraprevotella sp.]|nr:Bax inhibitor-1/YccA family protein [Paraprevotella sp.]
MSQGNYVQDYGVAKSASSVLFRKVYLWMTLALAITGLTALVVYNSPGLTDFIIYNNPVFLGLLIAEVVLVLTVTAAINRISFTTATLLFILYSILNGATMSIYLFAYTEASVANTFFITAGTFGIMSAYGSLTKRDLSSWGNLLFMALIGLIVCLVVNIFWKNSMFDLIISCIGVLLFTALTAYDSQSIKRMLQAHATEVNDTTQKMALMGALSIYLDFINLFIYLLRILGKRK